MIYTTGTIAINGNTVTGTGTNFSAPLSLIRVGCTLIAISNPIQIFTVTEIKSGTELSVTPAANPAIAAGTKFSILLSDSISVDGLAQDVAETLRYYQSKETEVAEALEWSQEHIADKIGLGAERRDWPDCNDPTEYIGFCRAEESKAKNFPSIASGEHYLVGWLSRGDGATINGCFVGTVTRSLYTYVYNNTDKSVGWTRHARKDEVDRFSQIGNDQTRIYAGNGKTYLEIGNDRSWGVYNGETGQWKPLELAQGGTAGRNSEQARTNLEVMHEKKSHLGSTDINTLTGEYSGFYHQKLNANATTESGYPEQSAGSLLVIKNGAGGTAGCTQLYFPYNGVNGLFYMRQHVIQSASTGWEWTAWKKFQSLDIADSPQFANLNLVKSSDEAVDSGGIFQSILNDASGAQRARTRIYTEFRGDGKAWATTHLRRGDQNKYAGLSEDGDFALSTTGDFVGRSARLSSNVTNPLTLQSAHPTIKFDETDRPEGSPDYAFIFDGGNWRIEKNHWETPVGGTAISYNFTNNEIEVPNLKVSKDNSALKRTSIYDSDFVRRLSIETKKTASTNSEMLFWGSDTRRSVLEYSYIDPDNASSLGYGFFCQLNTDNTVKFQVNGVVNCTTLNQSCDSDLKDNIQVISNATEAIRKMNGYTYTLKENGLPYAGIIAQEVMEAIPEAVGSFTHYGEALQGPTIDGNELREETRYLNVDYAAVTGLLVQVARETDNRVTELEEENASLRANIAVMDERITKLEALVRQLTVSEE